MESENRLSHYNFRISKISQAETLQPRPKQSTTKRIPLVLTYHPHMHRIKRIFLRNFKKILQHEKSDTEHIFTSPPLLAYRRDTNLKQRLVRSSLNPKPNGTHPCGHSLCRTCEHTPILPMPYLVPRTLSIFNTTLLAVSSIPDLKNT